MSLNTAAMNSVNKQAAEEYVQGVEAKVELKDALAKQEEAPA